MRFSLPPGWKSLEASLMQKIKTFEDNGGRVRQVKEKFGELRVYAYRVANQDTLDIAEEVEQASKLCMQCGNPAVEFQRVGWIGPRCSIHLQKD